MENNKKFYDFKKLFNYLPNEFWEIREKIQRNFPEIIEYHNYENLIKWLNLHIVKNRAWLNQINDTPVHKSYFLKEDDSLSYNWDTKEFIRCLCDFNNININNNLLKLYEQLEKYSVDILSIHYKKKKLELENTLENWFSELKEDIYDVNTFNNLLKCFPNIIDKIAIIDILIIWDINSVYNLFNVVSEIHILSFTHLNENNNLIKENLMLYEDKLIGLKKIIILFFIWLFL